MRFRWELKGHNGEITAKDYNKARRMLNGLLDIQEINEGEQK